MPKRRSVNPKQSSTFHLVCKSQEDPTYVDQQSLRTLALTQYHGKKVKVDEAMDWDSWEEMQMQRYNMHVADDTIEDEDEEDDLFHNAEECEFDQEFIQRLNEKPEDEEATEVNMENFPCHDAALSTSAFDHAFAKELKEFDNDRNIEMADERTKGPLEVDAYADALKEHVVDTKKLNFFHQWKGKECEVGEKITATVPMGNAFHEDTKGVFLTVLPSSKTHELFMEYVSQKKAAAKLTKQLTKQDRGAEVSLDCEQPDTTPQQEMEVIDKLCPPKKGQDWDCETILTTYSNIDNHPEVISELPDPRRKIKLSKKSGIPHPPRLLANSSNPSAASEQNGNLDEVEDLDDQLSTFTSSTTLGRPRDESAEEKHARKAQNKKLRQYQRERKKLLRQAFQYESIIGRAELTHAESQRRTLPL